MSLGIRMRCACIGKRDLELVDSFLSLRLRPPHAAFRKWQAPANSRVDTVHIEKVLGTGNESANAPTAGCRGRARLRAARTDGG